MSSISNLCQRLKIRPPLEQSTCIGYGQRKPTCGCAVAESSRLQAVARLQEINDNLDYGLAVSDGALHNIASLLLCKRWHQSQADENVQKWRRNLRETSATSSRAPLLNASSNMALAYRLPAPEIASVPQHSLESFSDRQLIHEMKRRARHTQSEEFFGGVLEIANTVLDRRGGAGNQANGNHSLGASRSIVGEVPRLSPSIVSRTVPPVGTSRAAHSSRTNLAQPQQNRPATVSATIPTTQPRIPRPEPAVESVRQARIAALTPVVTSPRPEPLARAPSPLRQSHLECVVCASSYEEDPDEQWECQTCLNRVHLHCFESWRASQPPGRVTCIHCRGRVSGARAA